MSRDLPDLLEKLRAAAERTRLRLLAICAEGELTVSEITRIVGQSQPRVSRHLKVLCDAGLLLRFREGHSVFYRVATKGAGAELAAQVLELLPRDDEVLSLDVKRMESLKLERAQLAAEYLRDQAKEWARLRDDNVSEKALDEAVLDELAGAHLGELLDIGTGTGRMLELLGAHAETAVGIDISSDMLLVARSKLHAAGLTQVMVRQGDMYRLPYADASFDTVIVDQVLYQAEDPRSVLREAQRILRPGGRVLVVDYAPVEASLDAGRHVARIGISEEQLRQWLEASGLRCVQVRELKGAALTVLLGLAAHPQGFRAAASENETITRQGVSS